MVPSSTNVFEIVSFKTVFMLISIITLLKFAKGHSFLIKPVPYQRMYEVGEYPNGCKPFECLACPKLASPRSRNENLPERPAEKWARGQRVTIQWAKNNHWGGFIRIAIVPVEKMFDHVHQKRLALYFGCWQQNVRKCTANICGSDRGMNLLQTQLVVPANIPDGVYVLAWVWFGGVHFKQDNPKFPDYYSCSFIRISGGADLVHTYQPYFDADNGRGVPGTCRVGFTEPGKCTQAKQCERGPVYDTVPTEFQKGRKPGLITKEMYLPPFPTFNEKNPSQTPTSLSTPSRKPKHPTASPIPFPLRSSTPTARPSKSPSQGLPPNPGRPVCAGVYCCPGFCGKCGGSGCSKRPGGSKNCCVNGIINSKRYCERDVPPCKLS